MTNGDKFISRTVRIVNELGLHARAASQIARTVQNALSDVWIQKNGNKVDASSIIDILTLSGTKDSEVTIMIENPSDLEILDAIETLFNMGFGE